jgi:hypothetical protein
MNPSSPVVCTLHLLPFLLIAQSQALFFNFLAQFEDTFNQGLRTGKPARNIDIDRDNRIDALHCIITIVELAARVGALAHADNPFRIRWVRQKGLGMPNWLVRSLLFGSSYLPMFPILILLHWDAHFAWALALGAVGLILLAVTLWFFGWQVRTMNTSSVTISEIAGHDSDTMSYIATYLFPLLSATLDTWKELLALVLTFAIVGFVYVNSHMIYINPTLSLLLRLHLYEVAIEGRDGLHFSLLTRSDQFAVPAPITVVELGAGILVEV